MRIEIIVYCFLVVAGCTSSNTNVDKDQVPPSMELEMLKLKSPLSGEIPSHLLHKLRTSKLIGGFRNKSNKVYPSTWVAVDDRFASLSISKMTYDPNNTQIYYFCTGEGWFNADASRGAGVWKSSDAGASWSQLMSTDSAAFFYCQDIVVNPANSDIYVSTLASGLMRSSDGGNSWMQVLSSGNGAQVDRAADIEITADNDIVVSMGIRNTDGIYISPSGDPGSWNKIMNGIPSLNCERIELATAPSNASRMYAIPINGQDDKIYGVYRSNDKGENWVEVGLPGGDRDMARVQGWYDLIIEVDPNNEDIVAAGGLNLWRSTDAGDTWQQLTEGRRNEQSNLVDIHVDQHEIVFYNSDTIYFGNDGGIFKSDNFRSDTPFIYSLNSNYNVTQYYAIDIEPKPNGIAVIGGTQDNGSNISTASGISEFEKLSHADGSFCAIDHAIGQYYYTTTQERRMIRSYGKIRDSLTNPYISNENTLFINPITMDENDPQILYQASNRGVWRLKNARTADKSEWQACTRPFGSICALTTSKSKPNLLVFGRIGSGIPYKVENANTTDATFTPIAMDKNGELPNAYLNCIVIDKKNENHILLIYTNYDVNSVYQTFNALDNDPDWESCEGNLPNLPIRWAHINPTDPKICYLATELGLYYTDSLAGNNTVWVEGGGSLPNLKVNMIKYRNSDKTYIAGTHGRGVFTGKVSSNSNDILWEERGPNNVAGRTRTIMVDPNHSNGKKLWAGSISGGLWVARNIDSVNHFEIINTQIDLGLFPNPAFTTLTVTFNTEESTNTEINIYNNSGQIVKSISIPFSSESHTFSISDLASGIYYAEIYRGSTRKIKKFLKL